MPPDQCSKHDECIGRINDNVQKIQLNNQEMKGNINSFIKTTSDFLSAIRKDTYSKDGLIDRVGNHNMQLGLQWGLMAAIIIGIIVYGILMGGSGGVVD